MRSSNLSWLVASLVILGLAGCAQRAASPPVAIERTYVIERPATPDRLTAAPTAPAAGAVDPANMPAREELGAVQDYGPAEAHRDTYLNQPTNFEPHDFGPTYMPWPVTNHNQADQAAPPVNADSHVTPPERVRTVTPAR